MDLLLSGVPLRERALDLVFAASSAHVAWLGLEGVGRRPLVVTGALVSLHAAMAALFVVRLPERGERSTRAWLPALPSLALGALVGGLPGARLDPPSSALFALGALGTLTSMLALGRSFAVLPGARRLVVRGPYRLVRHPMYASESLMFAALVLPLGWPLALGLGSLATLALMLRVRAEERALDALPGHREYARRVRYRLVPGVW